MRELDRYSAGRFRYTFNVTDLILWAVEYCWALLVILNGNSILRAIPGTDSRLMPLTAAMTVFMLVLNLMFGRIGIRKRNFTIAIGLFLYAFVYFVFQYHKMAALNYLCLFVVGLPCLFLLFAELHRKGLLMRLINRFVNLICVLSVISLFFWFFGTLLGFMTPNMTAQIRWGGFSTIDGYWGLHFQFQRETTFSTLIYRNTGVFTEAPMLNLWCNLALAIELFLKPKASKVRVVVLTLTVITTFSITGYFFLALCILLKCLKDFHKGKAIFKAMLILVLLVALPVAIRASYELLVIKAETESFAMRMSDYIGGVKLWLDYPLLGSGFGNLEPLMEYVYSPDGVVGFSNSVAAVLGTGGLWMSLLFYVPHVACVFPRATRSKAFCCFGVCILYLFITTIFIGRYLIVVLLALEMAVLVEKDCNEKIGIKP